METKSLYIHIPFCTSKCTYCDFYSIPVGKKFAECNKTYKFFKDYLSALKNEIYYRFSQFDIQLLKTIYIGGGTPSLFPTDFLKELLDFIKQYVQIHSSIEITMEANPQDISKNFLYEIKCAGVNRLSVGIQCYNDSVLKTLNRRCDLNQVEKALDLIKKYWIESGLSFSCDLISGLPNLSDYDFLAGIEKVILSGANHISLYSLTIEEGTVLANQISKSEVSYSDEKNDNQWILGRDFLEKNGFFQYEVSNFAKTGFESKHNITYWKIKNYLGCGAGATGTVDFYRWNNLCDVEKYIDFWINIDSNKIETSAFIPQITEQLSVDEKQFEFFMMGFRLREGVKESDFKELFGNSFKDYLGTRIEEWKKKRLIIENKLENDTQLSLSSEGILFLNQILEDLI